MLSLNEHMMYGSSKKKNKKKEKEKQRKKEEEKTRKNEKKRRRTHRLSPSITTCKDWTLFKIGTTIWER